MLETVITNGGLNEIAQATNGQKITLSKLWLGSGDLEPTGTTTELEKLEETVDIASSEFSAVGRVNIEATVDNPDTEYTIREIGIVTNNNVLFAVVGSAEPLAFKLKTQQLLLNFVTIFEGIPDDIIEVVGAGERLNLDMSAELAAMATQQTITQTKVLDLIDRVTRLEASR